MASLAAQPIRLGYLAHGVRTANSYKVNLTGFNAGWSARVSRGRDS